MVWCVIKIAKHRISGHAARKGKRRQNEKNFGVVQSDVFHDFTFSLNNIANVAAISALRLLGFRAVNTVQTAQQNGLRIVGGFIVLVR